MEKLAELSFSIAEFDDQKSFRKIFEYYFTGLLSFSSAILKNREDAEEVVEDVFLKLWENRKMLPTIKSLPQYLYVATKHTAFNYIAKQKGASTAIAEMGDDFLFSFSTPESEMISEEAAKKISSTIHMLPSKCRLIFRLVKEEGMRQNDVARLLDISIKTVETQLAIALKKMSEALASSLPEYNRFYKKTADRSK